MTAFAFILGVLPLVFASGAMAEARKVIGVTVCVGMLVATVFGVFFIPALFVIVDKFGKREPVSTGPETIGERAAVNVEIDGRP